MTTYTVKGGDTLSLIAERMLGDMSRWPEIATLNKIPTPNLILPGQVLQLPDPASSLSGDHWPFLDMAEASVPPLDKQILLVNELAFEPEAEDFPAISSGAIDAAVDLINKIYKMSLMVPVYSVPTTSGGVALIYSTNGSDYRYRFDGGQLIITKNNKRFFAGAPDEFTTAQHPGF